MVLRKEGILLMISFIHLSWESSFPDFIFYGAYGMPSEWYDFFFFYWLMIFTLQSINIQFELLPSSECQHRNDKEKRNSDTDLNDNFYIHRVLSSMDWKS